MIKLIDNIDYLNNLIENLPHCHYTDHIAFLAECYGVGYAFCEFYDADNSVICFFEKNSVIVSNFDNINYEEVAMFVSGTTLINAPYEFCKNILNFLPDFTDLPVDFQTSKISTHKSEHLNDNPKLDDVYKIVNKSFENIDYSLWLTDASHKVRHNLAKCYTYQNSASVTASFYKNGVFLSQVSTLPEMRKKGLARQMLHEVTSLYPDKHIYLIAEHSKREFYKACGFEITGVAGRLIKNK